MRCPATWDSDQTYNRASYRHSHSSHGSAVLKRRRLPAWLPPFAAVAAVTLILASVLLLTHQAPFRLTRDRAIDIALHGYDQKPERAAAKLVRPSDLIQVQPEIGMPISAETTDLVW